jgi:hypothetical protein
MDQTLIELIKALGYPLGTVITIGLIFYLWRQFFERTLESIVTKDIENLRRQNAEALEELRKEHSVFLEEKRSELAILFEQRKMELATEMWPAQLARELQKTRGVERQDLRFQSYGKLWKELRPLAVYDSTLITKSVVSELSLKLSDWYFSESGGLFLTPQSREFYFALQDLLRLTSKIPEEWGTERSEESVGTQQNTLREVLKLIGAGEANSILDYFSSSDFKDWQDVAAGHGKHWREYVRLIAASWNTLDAKQRFATLQQIGSILRSSLVNDLESRLS